MKLLVVHLYPFRDLLQLLQISTFLSHFILSLFSIIVNHAQIYDCVRYLQVNFFIMIPYDILCSIY